MGIREKTYTVYQAFCDSGRSRYCYKLIGEEMQTPSEARQNALEWDFFSFINGKLMCPHCRDKNEMKDEPILVKSFSELKPGLRVLIKNCRACGKDKVVICGNITEVNCPVFGLE